MSNQYYVRIRGRVSGPFAEERLKALIQRGQFSRAHEISEDSTTWRSAGELQHLFPRSSAREASPQAMADADLQIDDADARHSARPASQPTQEQWYLAVDGQKQGPFSREALQAKANAGALFPDSLVWKQGMEQWQPASSIPGLAQHAVDAPLAKPSQFRWPDLFPFFRLFSDGAWRLPWVQCLAIALLFPLFVIEYHGIQNFELVGAALLFSLYFSLMWTAFFHWCIRPAKPGPWRLIGVWLLTVTFGVFGVLIAQSLAIPIFGDALDGSDQVSLLKKVIGWTLAVGLIEEIGKVCAVLLLTINMQAATAPRTFAFIGVVSGLAFGTAEAVFYTHAYVVTHSLNEGAMNDAYGVLFMSLMTRWISLPLLHAIWTGIAGFWIGLSRQANSAPWRWVLWGVLTVSILHGLYDVGAGDRTYSWLGVTAAAATLALFVGYLRLEETLVQQVRNYRPRPLGQA